MSASRTGEKATVTSLLDSGAEPHFRDIVRIERVTVCIYSRISVTGGISEPGSEHAMHLYIF